MAPSADSAAACTGRSSVVRSSRPLRPGRLSSGRDGRARARADDDAARGRAGQLVLVARLEAELADVVADADLALRALDLLGRGRADGAQQRAGERLARRQLLGARHRLRALDRLDLLGQRGRVVGRAQGHRLDELLGARALGGAREGVAIHVQDAGQRGGARVDVLDRGAIEADPHDLAGGDERPALAVEDRRPRVGVADRPQAPPGAQARVDDASAPRRPSSARRGARARPACDRTRRRSRARSSSAAASLARCRPAWRRPASWPARGLRRGRGGWPPARRRRPPDRW